MQILLQPSDHPFNPYLATPFVFGSCYVHVSDDSTLELPRSRNRHLLRDLRAISECSDVRSNNAVGHTSASTSLHFPPTRSIYPCDSRCNKSSTPKHKCRTSSYVNSVRPCILQLRRIDVSVSMFIAHHRRKIRLRSHPNRRCAHRRTRGGCRRSLFRSLGCRR